LDALPGHRRAGLVEDGGGRAALLFVEVALVRDPGATGVTDAERLGLARDGLRVRRVSFVRKMDADGIEAALIEHLLELPGREVVGAGQFEVANSIAFHLVERGRDVAGELGAKAVELQAHRAFETAPHTYGVRARRGRRQGQ